MTVDVKMPFYIGTTLRFDRTPLGVTISQTQRPRGKANGLLANGLLPEQAREVAFLSNEEVERLKQWLQIANDR